MISVALPTYNRYQYTIEAVQHILNDARISEIVVTDDASTDSSYELLQDYFKYESKVRLFRNNQNLDCYLNKHMAISKCSTDWTAIIDSDNIIDEVYLAAVFDEKWDEKTILAPAYAYPNFDYTEFEDLIISKENVAEYMERPMFQTALNTMNFFVNKNEYLRVFDDSVNPRTSDSIYFNYCWLRVGNKIKFVKDMQYFHRVHEQSHYRMNNHKTEVGFHDFIIEQLKELR